MRCLPQLLSDPAQNTQLLTDQLRSLGLYAAPTLGDGNCLFRALSDQYFGTPSQHLKLREDICNWLEEHKQRYAPFVDDDRGMDEHLRCMRQPGTYGGHLELTAFAHLKKRDVKVIQPGLVYVIEWAAGADLSPTTSDMPKPGSPEPDPEPDSQPALKSREARKARRDKKKELKSHAAEIKQQAIDAGEDAEDVASPSGAVYVAYHDWEHFSSVRNLTGPHAGLPCVVERPVEVNRAARSHPTKPKSRRKSPSPEQSDESDEDEHSEHEEEKSESELSAAPPVEIPLPLSRSSSPTPSSCNSSLTSLSIPSIPGYSSSGSNPDNVPSAPMKLSLRIQRSPKRTFDESSGPYLDSSYNGAKRSRSFARAGEMMEVDPDADTPELLASGSSSDSSSSPASSPAPSPPPSMVIIPPTPVIGSKPLTRRQRKAMGLPKPRAALSATTRKGSAGKIVIPGGRSKKLGAHHGKTVESTEEVWEKNGSGRMDVRGFKELKI
ncbi:cysteine proteinase [Schizopora paradoxa]|uniref:Cysteine proteinase n=1 Tax=Schizopora paradoxa TaxID=27342 RepID=A0A0H2RY35_9AGAM|nr:cysteine proteinase [Schizopora paradoxa]